MSKPYRRFCLVYVLTAGSARFAGFEDNIGGVYLDLDFLGLGKNRDGHCRCVYAALRFGFRNALDAVDPRFKTESRVGTVAFNHKCYLAESAELGLVCAKKRDSEPF